MKRFILKLKLFKYNPKFQLWFWLSNRKVLGSKVRKACDERAVFYMVHGSHNGSYYPVHDGSWWDQLEYINPEDMA